MSNKSLYKRLSCYILVTLMFSFSVYGFSVSSTPESLSVCPTTTALITSVVGGEGEYTVTTTGAAARWATTVPLGFVNKGSKTVYTYVTPSSNALPGQYDLEITFSDGKTVERASKRIVVLDCFGVNLAKPDEQTVCPGETAKYDFSIRNSGNFQEAFNLGVSGSITNWVTLSDARLDLPAGESKSVFVYITIPTDARGTYDFTLNAAGQLGGSLDSVTSSVDVAGCYDYEVSTEKDFYELCDHTTQIVPIRVENQGTTTNEYILNLEGPDWVALERKSSTLGEGQQDDINVIVSPDYGVQGSFKVDVDVTDESGKIETSKHLNVDVGLCHDVLVQMQDSDSICAGLSNSYGVLVKNNGEFTQEFKLNKVGENWARLEEQLVELGSGEEKEVALNIEPGTDVVGTFDIKIVAENIDGGFRGEDTINIGVVSQEACFKPGISIDKEEISVGQDSTGTVPVTIENKGTQTSNFVIDVSGTASGFVELNPATIVLEPNEADTVFLYIAPKLNDRIGKYTASITVRLEDSAILESDSIEINVAESEPLVIQPEAPTEEVMEEEEEKSFWQRFLEFFLGEKPAEEEIIEIPEEISGEIEEENVSELPPEEEVIEEVSGEEATEEVGEEEIIEEEVMEEEGGVRELMSQGDEVTLTIKGEEHKVLLDIVLEDAVVLVIESDPVLLGLEIGESKDINLDNDNVNDLRVTFNGFVDGKADITYLSLGEEDNVGAAVEDIEEILSGEEATEEETTEVKENPLDNYLQSLVPYLNWVLIGVVVILLILVLFRYRKGIIDFFEEEDEDEELGETEKAEKKNKAKKRK